MKSLATVFLTSAICMASANAADTACLRGDNIDHIKMVGAGNATAFDRQNRVFDVTFVAPCGARHQNVFFILKPESLPACIVAGTALATNREGVCVIKTITPRT